MKKISKNFPPVKKYKIAIFFEEDYLGVYPSLINGIRFLANEGHTIDIIGTSKKSDFPPPPKFEGNVTFRNLAQNYKRDRKYENEIENEINLGIPNSLSRKKRLSIKYYIPNIAKIKYRFCRDLVKENLLSFKSNKKENIYFLKYLFFAARCSAKKKYDICFGIDTYGMIAALCSRFFISYKLHFFWALEFTEPPKNMFWETVLKKLETISHQKSDFLITQDENRAKSLCNLNKVKYQKQKFISVPHSKNSSEKLNNTYFFKNKFNTKDNDTLILHAGWIHDVMDSLSLASSTNDWPSNYKLIFHERMKRSPQDSYIKKMKKVCSQNTYFSLDPVSYDKLNEVLLSADIGIVNYKIGLDSASWSNLTKASGKIADYLSCGLPVLCSHFDGIDKLINKYKFGLVFKSYDEIPSCVEKILSDYEYYSKNALNCFEREYNFSNDFSMVANIFKQIKSVNTF